MTLLLLTVVGFAALWLLACLFGDVCDLLVFWWQKRGNPERYKAVGE